MKLKFAWLDKWKDGDLHPVPTVLSESASTVLVNCLSGVLMDDGGSGLDRLIKAHIELLEGIKQLKQNQIETFSWLIETWGVTLRNNQAEMYFAFDESYGEALLLDNFEKVITAWLAFIQSEPSIDNRVELEI